MFCMLNKQVNATQTVSFKTKLTQIANDEFSAHINDTSYLLTSYVF